MNDMEKVIKGLAHCTKPTEYGKGGNHCMDCPYTEAIGFNQFKCNGQQMMKDALALLKEQEAKTGRWIYKKYDDMFMCSCCKKYSIRNDYPYCHWCGAKMEGR